MSKGKRRWISQLKQRANSSFLCLFCSFLRPWIHDAHPHGWGQSSLFSLPTQMLIYFRNTFTDNLAIIFYQLSGLRLDQSSWHKIKHHRYLGVWRSWYIFHFQICECQVVPNIPFTSFLFSVCRICTSLSFVWFPILVFITFKKSLSVLLEVYQFHWFFFRESPFASLISLLFSCF